LAIWPHSGGRRLERLE
jgi:hypothetical protein